MCVCVGGGGVWGGFNECLCVTKDVVFEINIYFCFLIKNLREGGAKRGGGGGGYGDIHASIRLITR